MAADNVNENRMKFKQNSLKKQWMFWQQEEVEGGIREGSGGGGRAYFQTRICNRSLAAWMFLINDRFCQNNGWWGGGGGVIPKEFGNRVVFKFVDHLFMW